MKVRDGFAYSASLLSAVAFAVLALAGAPPPDTDNDGVPDSIDNCIDTPNPMQTDTDNDGAGNACDDDDDNDGLSDIEEAARGSDPLNPDTDGDGVCDGGNLVGTCTTAGPDNCPVTPNADQTNSDPLPAGDLCQCGDLDQNGIVNAVDAELAKKVVVGATIVATCDLTRCNVIGPADGGVSSDCNVGASSDCTVADVYVIERVAAGQPVTVENTCQAFTGL